jgi:muconolactone D-isomerase
MEFLVTLRQDWAMLRERADLVELVASERQVGKELIAEGALVRIWRLPGQRANVAVWRATDATHLDTLLARLPLWKWMDAEVVALATHDLELEP